MVFLLLFLLGLDAGVRGRSVPDHPKERLRAAAALCAAATGGVDIAWAAGAIPDGMSDLRVAQRIAEANIHLDGLRPCGQSASGSRGERRSRWPALRHSGA